MESLALYFCYAQKDKTLRDELEKHLATLKQLGQIATWSDGELQAGSEWREEIANHLRTADIILLLVSPDLLVAGDIYAEVMRQAFMRHEHKEALVIPILLRPVDLEGTDIQRLKALPDNNVPVTRWSNRDDAFSNVAKGIRQATNATQKRSTLHLSSSNFFNKQDELAKNGQMEVDGCYTVAQSVFLFNAPLTDADEFFGRRRERLTLLDRTHKGLATSIVGPRRIGKTWLMQHMMLAASKQFGPRYRIAYIDATSPRCVSVAGFVATVLEELKIDNIASSEMVLDLAYLDHSLKNIRRQGYMPVLCIDEFEGLANEQTFDLRFFTSLRAIAQAGLALVVASKSSLLELVSSTLKTSPFFNIFERLTLKPFSIKEAKKFVEARSSVAGFTQQECSRLLSYGQVEGLGWPPARLQLVGKLLLEEKRLSENEDADYYRPDDPDYWGDFEKRLEEKYQEMGS